MGLYEFQPRIRGSGNYLQAMGRTMASNGRMLLVEDNEDVRHVFAFMLKKLGYEVVECRDGLDAVDSFRKFRFDSAIIDVDLPHLDGFDVMEQIREIEHQNPWNDPDPKPLIAVALTGHSNDQQHDRATAVGFDLFFVKPVELERVCAEIESMTNNNSENTA